MSDIQTYISSNNSEAIIRRIIQTTHSSLDMDEIFEQIVQNLGIFLQADRCFIAMYDEQTQRIYPPTREYRSSEQMTSILEADPELWNSLSHFAQGLCEARKPVDFQDKSRGVSPLAQELLHSLHVQSGIGCMIRFQDECQAILFVHQVKYEREWTEFQREIIEVVTEQAGTAMHHARLYQRLKTLSQSRERIAGLFSSAMRGSGIQALYEQALDIVCEILEVCFAKIIEYKDDPEKPLLTRAVRGFNKNLVGQKFDPGSEPHSAYTMQARQPVKVIDIYRETRFKPSPIHFQYALTSGLSAVIFSGTDVYGVLEVDNQEKRNFSDEEVLFLQSVANVLGLIANRKEVEDIVRQTEERFRVLVENIQDYAIYMEDVQGCITSWNSGAERLFGYQADEIIGKQFSIFLSEEDISQGLIQQELDTAIVEGRFETEGWRFRKDGSRFWANVVINALRDSQGEVVGFPM